MKFIRYRSGYKYQLAETYRTQTKIYPAGFINAEWIKLEPSGMLTVRSGYAWDGASGPTFDTRSSMRGSLVHDATYQLLRAGLLPPSYRKGADLELYRICLEDGMWKWRARLWLKCVHRLAKGAASPNSQKRVFVAP